jgi:hypothetical protein
MWSTPFEVALGHARLYRGHRYVAHQLDCRIDAAVRIVAKIVPGIRMAGQGSYSERHRIAGGVMTGNDEQVERSYQFVETERYATLRGVHQRAQKIRTRFYSPCFDEGRERLDHVVDHGLELVQRGRQRIE